LVCEHGALSGAPCSFKLLHPRQHLFTIAAGDQPFLDFMHDNPSVESHPVSYTNHPTVIARHDNMISINAVIEVDLLGQANAEFMEASKTLPFLHKYLFG
jgi:itaconate CoA-transferase